MKIYYNIRPGMFPTNKKVNINYDRLSKFKDYSLNISFQNIDGYDMILQYKNNEHAFLFIDTPYLLQCNSFYNDPIHLQLFEILQDIKNFKCKILCVLDDNILIRAFIAQNNLNIVDITLLRYNTSKKSARHLYISN